MIARIWHGSTEPEHADAYEAHLKPELLPGLSQKKGFRGSHLLRRAVGNEVEFITIILWDSLDDVRAIAGPDYEKAIIPEDRLPLLSRYDARAAHYEVVSTNEPTRKYIKV
jgi:heme-degrading monooxygenase HmoA